MTLHVDEPTPPSPFVTVIARAPVAAPEAMLTVAVNKVPAGFLTTVGTVTPDPRLTEGVPLKPAPVIPTLWPLAPWPREDGLALVTVGAALTVKVLVAC